MWYNVYMNDLVTTLDEDLEYVEHELFKETLVMRVRSTCASVRCPFAAWNAVEFTAGTHGDSGICRSWDITAS